MYHKEKWKDQGRSRREKLGYCQQSTWGNSEGYSRLGGEETGQLLQDVLQKKQEQKQKPNEEENNEGEVEAYLGRFGSRGI